MIRVDNDIMKVGMNDTIQAIKQLEKAIIQANSELATVVKDKGVAMVKSNAEMMVNAEETMLKDEKHFATDNNVGTILRQGIVTEVEIINTSQEATYIEYGTGTVGAGSPHPEKPWEYYKLPSPYKRTIGGVEGWFHTSEATEEKFFVGSESQPFMWQSKIDIKKKLRSWFASSFRRAMKGGMK